MAITNATELQDAVRRWLHRGDLDAVIPDFVTLGEARINRSLVLPELQAQATIVPSQTERYVALPARFYSLVSFLDDQGEELEQVTTDDLEAMAAGSSPGRPGYYRLSSRVDFERTADADYSYTLIYYQRLDLLADQTNEVLSRHPDIYLYATLLSAAPYIKDDARVAMWAEMFKSAAGEANAGVRRRLEVRTELPVAGRFDIRVG